MLVAGDEESALAVGHSNEVIVVGIGRLDRRLFARVAGSHGAGGEPLNEPSGLFTGDPLSQLGVRKGCRELAQQDRRDDEFELSLLPRPQ